MPAYRRRGSRASRRGRWSTTSTCGWLRDRSSRCCGSSRRLRGLHGRFRDTCCDAWDLGSGWDANTIRLPVRWCWCGRSESRRRRWRCRQVARWQCLRRRLWLWLWHCSGRASGGFARPSRTQQLPLRDGADRTCLAPCRRIRDACGRLARADANLVGLVDVVALHALVLDEFDDGFLVLLLGVLDGRTDEHGDGAVRLLLQMRDKFRLENTPDDGVAFFARTSVESDPVVPQARHADRRDGRERDLTFQGCARTALHQLRDEDVNGSVRLQCEQSLSVILSVLWRRETNSTHKNDKPRTRLA